MALNPSHIVQIAIPVLDLARAKRFYGETLGLPHLFDAPPGLAFYQCGEVRLMLSDSEAPPEGAGAILDYSVPSAREAQRSLAVAGAAFEEDAHCLATVGGKEIWLAATRDGEGNRIGLMSEEAPA
jgi:methylmalonyl-CoA/ethylmalonyl-CoA epimerase